MKKKNTRDQSGFLEAPLVRQADGELKNRRFVVTEFVKTCDEIIIGHVGPRMYPTL